jgi:hypothetical protein
MKNKPICGFCDAFLEAESINVSRGINSVYMMGSRKPNLIPLQDEITLKLRCPKCGAFGDGLGDRVLFNVSGSGNIDCEINCVMVKRLTIDQDWRKPYANHFNPSRRDNCQK